MLNCIGDRDLGDRALQFTGRPANESETQLHSRYSAACIVRLHRFFRRARESPPVRYNKYSVLETALGEVISEGRFCESVL